MKRKNSWTKTEDDLILSSVESSIYSVNKVCKLLSKRELKYRTYNSIYRRYFYISKDKKLIPWTESDIKTLVTAVKKYPGNLSKAFIIAAEKLNRSPIAVENKWYREIRHNSKCFLLLGNNKAYLNSKNSNVGIKTNMLKKIINKLFN